MWSWRDRRSLIRMRMFALLMAPAGGSWSAGIFARSGIRRRAAAGFGNRRILIRSTQFCASCTRWFWRNKADFFCTPRALFVMGKHFCLPEFRERGRPRFRGWRRPMLRCLRMRFLTCATGRFPGQVTLRLARPSPGTGEAGREHFGAGGGALSAGAGSGESH